MSQTLSLGELTPNMPEQKRSKLATASGWDWKTAGDINEADIFEREYNAITGYYYAENTPMGRSILALFQHYKPVVAAWVKEFSYNEDKVGGSFAGIHAQGAQETLIRPLVPESFAHAQYTQQGAAAPETINLIPDDTQADGSTETATEDVKTWIIFGYAELIAGVPIATIVQEHINDQEGLRNPLYCYPQTAMTDLLLYERGSALWIETKEQLDIDYFVRNDTVTGFWPIGLECITESGITDIYLG